MGQIYEKFIKNNPWNIFGVDGGYEDGIRRTLRETNYAIVAPAESVSVSNYSCHLVAVPGELASQRLSIALTKNSSYTNLFNHL